MCSDLHGFDLRGIGMHPQSAFEAGPTAELPKDPAHVLGCTVTMSRNLGHLSLTPQMTADQRNDCELTIAGVFASFEGTDFAATRYALADASARPEVRARVAAVSRSALVANDDPFKESAGLYDGWPAHRSLFLGDDDSFVAVVNGLEHLVRFHCGPQLNPRRQTKSANRGDRRELRRLGHSGQRPTTALPLVCPPPTHTPSPLKYPPYH